MQTSSFPSTYHVTFRSMPFLNGTDQSLCLVIGYTCLLDWLLAERGSVCPHSLKNLHVPMLSTESLSQIYDNTTSQA